MRDEVRGFAPEQFNRLFADHFDLDPAEAVRSAHLVEDLGFDSVMYVELTDMLEDIAGHPLADGAVASLRTIGDVYDFCAQMLLDA